MNLTPRFARDDHQRGCCDARVEHPGRGYSTLPAYAEPYPSHYLHTSRPPSTIDDLSDPDYGFNSTLRTASASASATATVTATSPTGSSAGSESSSGAASGYSRASGGGGGGASAFRLQSLIDSNGKLHIKKAKLGQTGGGKTSRLVHHEEDDRRDVNQAKKVAGGLHHHQPFNIGFAYPFSSATTQQASTSAARFSDVPATYGNIHPEKLTEADFASAFSNAPLSFLNDMPAPPHLAKSVANTNQIRHLPLPHPHPHPHAYPYPLPLRPIPMPAHEITQHRSEGTWLPRGFDDAEEGEIDYANEYFKCESDDECFDDHGADGPMRKQCLPDPCGDGYSARAPTSPVAIGIPQQPASEYPQAAPAAVPASFGAPSLRITSPPPSAPPSTMMTTPPPLPLFDSESSTTSTPPDFSPAARTPTLPYSAFRSPPPLPVRAPSPCRGPCCAPSNGSSSEISASVSISASASASVSASASASTTST
ncbi:hypothetical protein BDK51DRAFT_38665, partial [Blyttiomyces helicus]